MNKKLIIKPIYDGSDGTAVKKYAVVESNGSENILFTGTKGECQYYKLKIEEDRMPF